MQYEYIIKLICALLLGLLIGIDRQLKHKPLGMKTSMVISVASCLITIVSIEAVNIYSVAGHTNMDPMRLAAQVVSGVGFIGAGAILRRSNDVISGLTTAAMVWAASGLGIAAGAGFYKEAFTAVILIILAINLFPLGIKLWGPQKLSDRDLSVLIIVKENAEMARMIDEIERDHMRVKHIKLKDLSEERQQIQMVLSAPRKVRTTSIYYMIKKLENVIAVEVETISA
ncbi:MgtC/SapB family protein [Paenibacillus sp. N1-5-1-14]|uniref:MgtC/SapB family protein n=1 Tax=Paenibacillus radicibacter TaxID=2972488 RepID=UPI002158BDF3|nr:MgtC/SapB family protein [Paenibacillus radicibacter]MCR8644047.1 MgtC/SapB family protein [Paenibacillus radicibacter]